MPDKNTSQVDPHPMKVDMFHDGKHLEEYERVVHNGK